MASSRVISLISWLQVVGLGACHCVPPPQHQSPPPIVFELHFQPNDIFQGFYTMSGVSIGSPGQNITIAHDTSKSDVFVISEANAAISSLCHAQTPQDTCMGTFDNASSTTFNELGKAGYDLMGGIEMGDYFSDSIQLGQQMIHNQTMAAGLSGLLPFNYMGFGFPQAEVGKTGGTFPEYPTLIQSMQAQGIVQSQTQSLWLNPSGDDPAAFPNGQAMFGALDTSLYEGELVTLPLVSANSTTIPDEAYYWTIALTGLQMGGSDSLVADESGDACVICSAQSRIALAPDTLKNLLATYPSAKLNTTTQFYDIPCDQRFNESNSWKFTVSDPRDSNNSVTIEVPSRDTIWPSNLVVTGGDPNTCSLVVNTFPLVSGSTKHPCAFGAAFLKQAYTVLDMGNAQISIAKAADGSQKANVIAIPNEGVTKLGL